MEDCKNKSEVGCVTAEKIQMRRGPREEFIKMKKILLYLLCVVSAAALLFTGCASGGKGRDDSSDSASISLDAESGGSEVGQGSKSFQFAVFDADGNETDFTVRTDRETVGEALLENGLIEGEEGEFGLYVKAVNGIVADFDTDGTYWAFYVNGEYAMTGVDSTVIKDGESYSFRVSR